jgi:sulfur-oxidizing protein SoxY
MTEPSRRSVLTGGLAVGGAGLLMRVLLRPASATPDSAAAAVKAFLGDAEAQPGRVRLDIPPLVENGNAVPLTVSVDSPMTREAHVTEIAVFNEKNPQPNVAIFHLGPRAGRGQVATRMRLADSQRVTAVARLNDGSCWTATADVIVTLAACVES